MICLEREKLTQETLRAMIALEPQMIICLDAAFGDDAPFKTNIVLEMEAHNVMFRSI